MNFVLISANQIKTNCVYWYMYVSSSSANPAEHIQQLIRQRVKELRQALQALQLQNTDNSKDHAQIEQIEKKLARLRQRLRG